MSAYYNEIDPFCVEWLKNLIKAKLIADGEVDGRSITEVQPEDLRGFKQCHFFAGIGLWSLALRNAGVDDSESFWSGSCPCQPFSNAGHQKAEKDERHLWPEWFRLIRECNPPRIVGEQVASAIRFNWLDLVQSDLESQNYAVGKAVLGACSVGAPHQRQRLYFVADSRAQKPFRIPNEQWEKNISTRLSGENDFLDVSASERGCGREKISKRKNQKFRRSSQNDSDGADFWGEVEWFGDIFGKYRPIKPGIRPLVDGYTSRMGILRAIGNAIVPQVATEFIKAYLEARGG